MGVKKPAQLGEEKGGKSREEEETARRIREFNVSLKEWGGKGNGVLMMVRRNGIADRHCMMHINRRIRCRRMIRVSARLIGRRILRGGSRLGRSRSRRCCSGRRSLGIGSQRGVFCKTRAMIPVLGGMLCATGHMDSGYFLAGSVHQILGTLDH